MLTSQKVSTKPLSVDFKIINARLYLHDSTLYQLTELSLCGDELFTLTVIELSPVQISIPK